MYNYLDQFAGTQIRADGARYETGEGPDTPAATGLAAIRSDISDLQDDVTDLDERVTVLEDA